jgi:hypothetical protein
LKSFPDTPTKPDCVPLDDKKKTTAGILLSGVILGFQDLKKTGKKVQPA